MVRTVKLAVFMAASCIRYLGKSLFRLSSNISVTVLFSDSDVVIKKTREKYVSR